MEGIIKEVLGWVPESMRPYVALFLLVLYVVTKIRSMIKTVELDRRCAACPVSLVSAKGIVGLPAPKKSALHKAIDMVF